MTAGYEPSDPAAPQASAPQRDRSGQDAVPAEGRDGVPPGSGRLTADSYDRSGPRASSPGPDQSPLRPLAADGPETERLGPLPPRMTSPAGSGHTGQIRPAPGSTAAMPPGSYPPPYGPPPGGYHTGPPPASPISGSTGYGSGPPAPA